MLFAGVGVGVVVVSLLLVVLFAAVVVICCCDFLLLLLCDSLLLVLLFADDVVVVVVIPVVGVAVVVVAVVVTAQAEYILEDPELKYESFRDIFTRKDFNGNPEKEAFAFFKPFIGDLEVKEVRRSIYRCFATTNVVAVATYYCPGV